MFPARWFFGLFLTGSAAAAPIVPQAARRLEAAGTHPIIAERASRHVMLGMPSAANRTNPSDYLLVRKGYVMSYNSSRNAMNWASWTVGREHLGGLPRTEAFRADPTLPSHFYRPTSLDYKLPGFSRGHMVRAGERTANARENAKTYVFSNMLPQAQNNNAGPWNGFEDYYRDLVKQRGLEAHVMAGGIFEGSPTTKERKVAVPSATWKVVALLEPGKTLADVDQRTRVIGIIVPNNNREVKVSDAWERYRVPVHEIARRTGLKFFDHLAPEVAATLTRRVDNVRIPAPPARRFETHNYQPPQMVARGLYGRLKVVDDERGFAFIRPEGGGRDVFVRVVELDRGLKPGARVRFNLGENKRGPTAYDVVAAR